MNSTMMVKTEFGSTKLFWALHPALPKSTTPKFGVGYSLSMEEIGIPFSQVTASYILEFINGNHPDGIRYSLSDSKANLHIIALYRLEARAEAIIKKAEKIQVSWSSKSTSPFWAKILFPKIANNDPVSSNIHQESKELPSVAVGEEISTNQTRLAWIPPSKTSGSCSSIEEIFLNDAFYVKFQKGNPLSIIEY
jgi:hypothetical protein